LQGRRFVVVPPTPVVPDDEDSRVLPISRTAVAFAAGSDGIHDRSDPGRSACPISRMVRILRGGNHPTYATQAALLNISEHVGRMQINVVRPLVAQAVAVKSARLADVLNSGRSSPDETGIRRVVFPGKRLREIAQSLELEAGISLRTLPSWRC